MSDGWRNDGKWNLLSFGINDKFGDVSMINITGWGNLFLPFLMCRNEGHCHLCEIVWDLVTLHPQLAIIFIYVCSSAIYYRSTFATSAVLGQRIWKSWILFTRMPETASLALKPIIKCIQVSCRVCVPSCVTKVMTTIPASVEGPQIHKEPLNLSLVVFKSKRCRNLANFLIWISYIYIFN